MAKLIKGSETSTWVHCSSESRMSWKLFSFVSGTHHSTNKPPTKELIEKITIKPLMPSSSIIDSKYFRMTKAKIHERQRQHV